SSRRGGSGRNTLRAAAFGAIWRNVDMPCFVRALQYARGGRRARRGADQGADIFCMTEAFMADGDVAETRPNEPAVAGATALPPEEIDRMTDNIVAALKTVYDPEIPADIYELGLIYRVDIEDDRSVKVDMTLTTPNCPSAAELPMMVENAVASVRGVSSAKCNVV